MQKSMIKILALADVITLINAIFGFLAIVMLFSDQLRISFSLILLALLADGLDGIVARKTVKGKMGEYLEAMADMISLSIAPMIFVYTIYNETIMSELYLHILILGVFILFLICSIIRLSSFHILKDKKCFIGLPASASTIFILILAFLQIDFIYILPFIAVMSFAMVSPIRFPKPGLKINAVAAVLIFLTIIVGDIYCNIASLLLFTALALYVIIGPFYLRKNIA